MRSPQISTAPTWLVWHPDVSMLRAQQALRMPGQRLGAFFLCAVLSCGCRQHEPAAADGGSSGESGKASIAAAGGGKGGKGGTGEVSTDPTSDCHAHTPFAGVLLDGTGKQVKTSLTAQVTVVSLEDCDSTCPSDARADGRRIVLEESAGASDDAGAGGVRWTLVARVEGLPADLIQTGDAYELTLTAINEPNNGFLSSSETVVALVRDGALVLALVTQDARSLQTADLTAFGLGLARDAVYCDNMRPDLFGILQYSLRVARQDESVVIAPGSSASLAGLTVHLSGFDGVAHPNVSDAHEKLWLGIYSSAAR
jgi:hypothetical protein